MDKEFFLQKYIDIETKIFIKPDKNKKLDDLLNDKINDEANFSLTDILDIISNLTLKKIKIRQPLYKNFIYPILSDHVEQNNVDAVKALLQLDQHLLSYQGYTKDTRYSSWTLLQKGLSISPNDKELLEFSERTTKRYLNYTLHELPVGVLYGADGATIEQCDELLDDLKKYEETCIKLNIDNSELVEECKFYYSKYKSYLSVYKNFKGFSDYLDKTSNEQ